MKRTQANELFALALERDAAGAHQRRQVDDSFEAVDFALLDHSETRFTENLSRGKRKFYLAADYTHYLYLGKQYG
jgi:hypothetical protein